MRLSSCLVDKASGNQSRLIIAPTKDSNFRAESVDRIIAAARPIFKLHGHEDRLRVEHPDCTHDFPPEMRETAYKLFDSVLAGK